ncbi:hypothetical protein J31TS6_52060 [Brevibacillus reuszeri]|uniref:DUF3147 family protein n=1 Tax=Brevibacillus reuszeri TaxID=54915 RepID=UPI001B16F5A5|nr:DUF3147 family protein [Brevibacillus reuszeri]GIO09178.1 hypothetical protein J31TS6_52060 [Brevibacillus reuszeri]
MYTIVKIILSAAIIGIITEVARRFPAQGGIIAALPTVSILSIIWLYVQGEQVETLSKFAFGVVYGIPSTIVMLVIVGIALTHSLHLVASLGLGVASWLLALYVQDIVVKHFT